MLLPHDQTCYVTTKNLCRLRTCEQWIFSFVVQPKRGKKKRPNKINLCQKKNMAFLINISAPFKLGQFPDKSTFEM